VLVRVTDVFVCLKPQIVVKSDNYMFGDFTELVP
jgi:hypothetical protein